MIRRGKSNISKLVNRTVPEHAWRDSSVVPTEAADVLKHPALAYIEASPEEVFQLVRENCERRWGRLK